jgi:hypothetical protein
MVNAPSPHFGLRPRHVFIDSDASNKTPFGRAAAPTRGQRRLSGVTSFAMYDVKESKEHHGEILSDSIRKYLQTKNIC